MRIIRRPSAFEAVISAIYRAALDHSAWREALTTASDYIGASGGLLLFNDLRRGPEARSWSIVGRLRTDLTNLYLRHYVDNGYSRAISTCVAGNVYTMSDLVDSASIVRTAFHADIIAPQRIADQLVLPYASWQRGHSSGGVSFTLDTRGASDLRLRQRRFAQLAPHLLRALDLGAMAEVNDAARYSLWALLDTVALPAMLLNEAGDLARVNSAAEALLREGDGLRVGVRAVAGARRVQASRQAETQMLAAAIGRAVAAADPEGSGEPDQTYSVRIGRPSGRPDLAVCVVPLPVRASPWLGPATIRAALFVLQPGRSSSEADARAAAELGAVYGLTRAEQRVTALVGAGLGLPETARLLGVSVETARTHLHRSFAKTGARSQVDLARLMAMFPAGRPTG